MKLMRQLLPSRHRRGTLYPVESFRKDLDSLFEAWSRDLGPFLGEDAGESSFIPSIDVVTNDNELRVTAELPGLEEDDIKVELSGGRLILTGKKHEVRSAKRRITIES